MEAQLPNPQLSVDLSDEAYRQVQAFAFFFANWN